MSEQKLFAQFVWEDVLQNKTRHTLAMPDHETAIAFGVKNNATYLTTYVAAEQDDAKADRGGRAYLLSPEAELQTAADVIRKLEQDRDVPHIRAFTADILPRMFGRASRDSRLQEKFSAAAARTEATEKFNALLDILRKDAPDQAYLTPNSAGYIRLEKSDEVYDAQQQRRYPAPAPRKP